MFHLIINCQTIHQQELRTNQKPSRLFIAKEDYKVQSTIRGKCVVHLTLTSMKSCDSGAGLMEEWFREMSHCHLNYWLLTVYKAGMDL